MGLFGSSTVNCQRCSTPVDKKRINVFDSTIRGEARGGEKLKLCGSCLMAKVEESLACFKNRAVVIYPANKIGKYPTNCYQFYKLDLKYGWSKEYIEAVRAVLPPQNSVCASCGFAASFNFVSPEIVFLNPFSEKVNQRGNYQEKFLCAKCLASEFKKKFDESNLYFDEFLPPTVDDSFGINFQV
jgi:hypothetical protein